MMDLAGKLYPYRVQSFKSADGVERANLFRDLHAGTLPCGQYAYELVRSDTTAEIASRFGRASGTVDVEDTHQVLTVLINTSTVITPTMAFSNDQGYPPGFALRGIVKGLPNGARTWIRLLAVSRYESREVEPDPDGNFEFYQPAPGEYVVLVLQPGRLVAAQHLVVSFPAAPSIEIDVSSP
jgi:hypothetical protein